MHKFWHSAQALKTAAATLLALALMMIAAVHLSGQKAVAIQGPGIMRVIAPDRVWLGVNRDLWVLDAAGHKLAQKTAQQLGLSAGISNIAPAPDGKILLTARRQASWVVLNSADLSVAGSITPQWPDDFNGNAPDSIHVAVSPAWDIAVATGGGHAVLLFDKNGRLKARTPQGAYNFTNGLWHSPEGWWTTDTNRFVLRLLDNNTLTEKTAIPLKEPMGLYGFLGQMTPSQGMPQPASGQPPLATLSRLGYLMEPGYVVDVFPDGSQAAYNHDLLARVLDIGWLGDNLLVLDGENYQVLRFSARREALPPFGDAEVIQTLAQMREQRLFWDRLSSRYLFLPAVLLLLLGMAAYQRHKKILVMAVIAERPASRPVGTPTASSDTILKQWLWVIAWPVLVRTVVAFTCLFGVSVAVVALFTHYGVARLWSLLLLPNIVMLPIFLVALWQQHRLQRFSLKPAYEAMLNRQAVAWLEKHSDWDQIRSSRETPRETLQLRGTGLLGYWRKQWLLVTNQRVLLFAATVGERRLINEWPRSAVVFAGLPEQPRSALLATLKRWLIPQANLRVCLNTGDTLTGISPSAVTAERTATLLMQARPTLRQAEPVPAPKKVASRRLRSHRWHQVLASLILPGSGQWLQNRFVSGTVYFTVATLLLIGLIGPILWAISGPKMQVSSFTKFSGLYFWLILISISSRDAYQFSGIKTSAPKPDTAGDTSP